MDIELQYMMSATADRQRHAPRGLNKHRGLFQNAAGKKSTLTTIARETVTIFRFGRY